MKITVADYLIKRLSRLGIKEVFGLPGDFNFNILDAVENCPDTKWVNCTNELNAGYAADGYARVAGFGALVTTFGVGELSAVNAIAGSFAENIPVFKIAGVPNSLMIKNNVVLHHNFHKPDYYAFERVFSNVTETTAFLTEENAKNEIDRLVEVFVKTRRPVYVAIPVDVCNVLVDAEIPCLNIKSNEKTLAEVLYHIKEVLDKSKRPVLLADYLVKRFGLTSQIESFVEKTKMPITSFLMGKGGVDETSKAFIGTNLGNISNDLFLETMNDSDCILGVGTLFSDLNTGGFSAQPKSALVIDIQDNYTIVEGMKYSDVQITDVVNGLLTLNLKEYSYEKVPFGYVSEAEVSDEKLKVAEIFPELQGFLKENDLLVVETGIISFAGGMMRLPKNVSYHSQTLWGSIGWATPALFGAAMADRSRRPILITGEGSHQLTVQEIANMFKYNIKPIIMVLNNSGYTIERILSHDPMDEFNNITPWDYSKLPEVFGSDFYSAKVRSSNELKEVLQEAAKNQLDKLCYIELFTDMMDVPPETFKVVQNAKNFAKTLMAEECS